MHSLCFFVRRSRRLIRRIWRRHTFLLLVFCFFILLFFICSCFGGCSIFSKSSASFDEYLANLFVEEVSQNTLTLHYTLTDPASRGILPGENISLGDLSKSGRKEQLQSCQREYDILESYHYSTLSTPQRFSFDILHGYLENQLALGGYSLYGEYLSPYNGVHAELPILLSEYEFRSKEDVEIYLELLQKVPDYFDDILAFEKEKAAAGLFMSDEACCMVIDSCDQFAEKGITPFLADSFARRVNALEELSEDQVSVYIEENQTILDSQIAPAYRKMARTLTGFLGKGRNNQGLCMYENGKEYYTLLVQSEVGCEDSMEDLFASIEEKRNRDMDACAAIVGEDPSLVNSSDSVELDFENAESMLERLKTQLCDDFPIPCESCCEICTIDSALSDALAPAFYITAPLDDYTNNTVYINTASDYSDVSFFTTLAHESYPGHLYQTTMSYYYGLPEFRTLLDFPGYTEGWATYVEMKSYYYCGVDTNMACLLQNSQSVILSLYASSDIGIHYYGWGREELARFWADYGVTDPEVIDNIRKLVLYEPGNYLRYYVGYLKFEELKEYAKESLGDDFEEKRFHQAILRMGPAPFPLLEKYFSYYYE